MDKQNTFYKILNEICEEKNIEQNLLSYGWIRELKKDGNIHHVIGYQLDLNSANAYNIAKDKYATYEVLKNNNIPMIEHSMVFSPITRSTYFNQEFISYIKEMLEKNCNKIVVKANDSSQGKDVYCCHNQEEAEKIVTKIFAEHKDSVSICPYIEIDYEYRVIVLDGQVLYTYKKRKPYITGDGKHTIKELIKNKYNDHIEIDLSGEIDENEILEENKEISISWKHNLSNGAEPILIENDEYLEKIKEIAIKAEKAIGIRFATIDIALTNKKELSVVEVNGSVCMNKFAELVQQGYDIAKFIYSKAIDKMFEN